MGESDVQSKMNKRSFMTHYETEKKIYASCRDMGRLSVAFLKVSVCSIECYTCTGTNLEEKFLYTW